MQEYIVDLHTHISKKTNPLILAEKLSEGITGLATINEVKGILSYDDALKLRKLKEIKVTEIKKGIIARITYGKRTGYFIKAQEILADNHVLALGCKETIPTLKNPLEVIKKIREKRGFAILNHPFIKSSKLKIKKYSTLNMKQKERLKELFKEADAVEVFNAQCINLLPDFLTFRFMPLLLCAKKANEKAEILAKKLDVPGIASSDAHKRVNQVHVSGVLVKNFKNFTLKKLFNNIKNKDFELKKQYISRIDFFKSHFL